MQDRSEPNPRTRVLLLAVAVMALTSASCGTERMPSLTAPDHTRIMTATIDGASWSAAKVTFIRSNIGTLLIGTDSGQTATPRTVVVYFQTPGAGALAAGSAYQLAEQNSDYAKLYVGSQAWRTSTDHLGIASISSCAGSRVAGTFEFDGVMQGDGANPLSRRVTQGTFNIGTGWTPVSC